MIIYKVLVISAGPAAWYKHMVEKEVDVVKTEVRRPFQSPIPMYRLFSNKLPVKYIRIEDTQMLSSREATNAEINDGRVHLRSPKGR